MKYLAITNNLDLDRELNFSNRRSYFLFEAKLVVFHSALFNLQYKKISQNEEQ